MSFTLTMIPLSVVKMEKFNGQSVGAYIYERLSQLTALEVRVISAMVDLRPNSTQGRRRRGKGFRSDGNQNRQKAWLRRVPLPPNSACRVQPTACNGNTSGAMRLSDYPRHRKKK